MADPVAPSSSNTTNSHAVRSHGGTWRSLLVENTMRETNNSDASCNSENPSQSSYYSVDLEEIRNTNASASESARSTKVGAEGAAAVATSGTSSSSSFRPRTLLSFSKKKGSSSAATASATAGADVPYDKESNNSEPSNDARPMDQETAAAYSYSTEAVHWIHKVWDNWQLLRHTSGQIVNSSIVQQFIVALIGINAIMMGVATFPFVTQDETVSSAFELVDTIFLIIFTVELGMQLLYAGWRLFLDGWLVFDFIIIVMSWSFSSMQIIRAFRIFRALRLITRIKVMKNLVLALFGVMPRMFAIGLLLLLVSYIFAVMCTQLFKDLYPEYTEENYWGRLDNTFFSLFQIMTLDNWADITRETMVAYPWAWCPIIIFLIITGFVVVNLIIAVICDAISALHEDDKARLHGNYAGDEPHEDDDSPESYHPTLQADVRQQLAILENHVEELTKMQEETMLTLQMLAANIAEQRVKRKRQQAPATSSKKI